MVKRIKETIQVDGLRVSYEVTGAGEPLVLIHGLAESTRLWDRNVRALAERYRVYLVDLPGFGAMRGSQPPFELAQADVWLAAWMRAVGLEAATLIGHSMGGYIAMALAAAHPEQVRSLVLVDSIGTPFDRPLARLIPLALKAVVCTASPALWFCAGYDYLRAGHATVMDASRQIVGLDASAVIAAVRSPALLIWGEHDDLVPSRSGRQLSTSLSDAQLYLMRRANHYCMYERPDEFNQVLLSFLHAQENSSKIAQSAD